MRSIDPTHSFQFMERHNSGITTPIVITQRIWSHLLKKPLVKNFILCVVTAFKKFEVIRSALE